MSSITGLISGGGGGGTPVNGIERLYVGGQTQYTDEAGGVWLKTGNTIPEDTETYPDAFASPPEGVSGSSYDSKSINVNSQDSAPSDVAFNSDGTKMYIIGDAQNRIFQYSLSTAWDVSTASYDSVAFYVSGQETNPQALEFKSDGTKMYVLGYAQNRIFQYSLSTAWDISTASYDNLNFSLAIIGGTSYGLSFNNDGTKFYVTNSSQVAWQFSLSTAWDITTASYDFVNFGTSFPNTPYNTAWASNGTVFLLCGNNNATIYQFDVSTAYDLSTASYNANTFSVGESSPRGIALSSDESKMYIVGTSNDTVYQYSIPLSNIIGLSTDTGTYDYIKLK